MLAFSGKELLILEILSDSRERELYGIEIIERSDGKLKRGTVYVYLNRLEEKGWVSSRKETDKEKTYKGLPRRLYRITENGIREWQQRELEGVDGVLVPA